MSRTKLTLSLPNLIKINYAKSRLYFQTPYNKKYYQLLKIFKSLSIIASFNIYLNLFKNLYFIKINLIYFKYQPLYVYFKAILKKAPKYKISYHGLKILNTRLGNSTYLLSTPQGLINHKEALHQHSGGQLIYFISF